MKILHIIPSIHPRYGGPSKKIWEISEGLIKKGVVSHIATTHFKHEKIDSKHKNIFSFRSYLGEYKYSPGLKNWLEENMKNYDLVHIYSVFCYSTLIGARTAEKYGKPYVLSTTGQLYRWCLDNKSSIKKKLYLKLFEMRSLNKAARIHFTSKDEKENVAIPLKNRSFVLEIGINCPRKFSKREFEKNFPELIGKKVLLYLSRIHEKKRPDLLINAARDILKQDDNFVLVMAGSGEENYLCKLKNLALKSGIQERVLFPGFLHGMKKELILQHSLAFILPSLTENFGISVVEAMASGLPVLISDKVGISREIKENNAGLVFGLDEHEIKNSINRVISDVALRQNLARNAKRMVRTVYNWDRIIDEQIKIYEGVLRE